MLANLLRGLGLTSLRSLGLGYRHQHYVVIVSEIILKVIFNYIFLRVIINLIFIVPFIPNASHKLFQWVPLAALHMISLDPSMMTSVRTTGSRLILFLIQNKFKFTAEQITFLYCVALQID